MTKTLKLMGREELSKLRKDIKSHVEAMERRIVVARREMLELDKLIQERDEEDIKVSDHAIVRWLERKMNIDVESLRKQIAEMVRPHIGSGSEIDVGDLTIIMTRGTVVTVIPRGRLDLLAEELSLKPESQGQHRAGKP